VARQRCSAIEFFWAKLAKQPAVFLFKLPVGIARNLAGFERRLMKLPRSARSL
jgi:hypothetical protein